MQEKSESKNKNEDDFQKLTVTVEELKEPVRGLLTLVRNESKQIYSCTSHTNGFMAPKTTWLSGLRIWGVLELSDKDASKRLDDEKKHNDIFSFLKTEGKISVKRLAKINETITKPHTLLVHFSTANVSDMALLSSHLLKTTTQHLLKTGRRTYSKQFKELKKEKLPSKKAQLKIRIKVKSDGPDPRSIIKKLLNYSMKKTKFG